MFFVEAEDVAGDEVEFGFGVGEKGVVEAEGLAFEEAAEVGVGLGGVEAVLVGLGAEGEEPGIGAWGEGGEVGGGEVFLGEAGFPVGAGGGGLGGAVVAGGEAGGELFFGLHGVAVGGEGFAEEEEVVAGHEGVGDAHGFAEDFLGGLAESDVVAVAFGHFFDAVEAFEEGDGDGDLGGLTGVFLEVAADEEVEELVGAAEFDVGADFDGVPALHDGVLDFVEADFAAGFDAIAEVFALEHLLEGDAAVEADHFGEGHLAKPGAVVDDFGAVAVEDFEDLIGVSAGVVEDLRVGEGGAGGGAAGGVADHGGEVADDEDRGVAEFLKLAQLFQGHAVAEVEVGGGGVGTELDAQGTAEGEFVGQFFFGVDLDGAPLEEGELVGDGVHEWKGQGGHGWRGCGQAHGDFLAGEGMRCWGLKG